MSGEARQFGSTGVASSSRPSFLGSHDGRQRDLFPLPSALPRAPISVDCCRKVQRRLAKRVQVDEMVEECVRCLNALYSGGNVGAVSSTSTISQGHAAVHKHLLNFCATSGPATGGSGWWRGAFAAPRLRWLWGEPDPISCQTLHAGPPLSALQRLSSGVSGIHDWGEWW